MTEEHGLVHIDIHFGELLDETPEMPFSSPIIRSASSLRDGDAGKVGDARRFTVARSTDMAFSG